MWSGILWRSSPEIDFIAPEHKGIVDCCLLCFCISL